MRSEHTIQAYKDTINSFLLFLKSDKGIELHSASASHFCKDNILDYLEWLRVERNNSDSTRNQRLMNLRLFYSYLVGENFMNFADYSQIKQIRKIPTPDRAVYNTLTIEDMKLLLEMPDISKKTNLRDRFYIALLYDTGCRNGEILNLKMGDIQVNRSNAYVNILNGKDNKSRTTPLSSEIIKIFEQYSKIYHPSRNPDEYLFYTKRKGVITQMSPDNTARFLKVYGNEARKIKPSFLHLHPHLFRHTRVMHLYQAGMPLPLVGQWLGHSKQETTLIYAYADIEMKRKALEKLAISKDTVFTNESFKYQGDESTIRKLYGLK